MDSDAKPGGADFLHGHVLYHKARREEGEATNQKKSDCAWCRQPTSVCLGDCLYKLSTPSITTPRKHYQKHIKRRIFNARTGNMVAPPSPSSSPRAYSPPPAPEVQLAGPKSPAMLGEPGPVIPEPEDTAKMDQGATRRIRPGTRAADMASGPPLIPLNQVGLSGAIVSFVGPGTASLIYP